MGNLRNQLDRQRFETEQRAAEQAEQKRIADEKEERLRPIREAVSGFAELSNEVREQERQAILTVPLSTAFLATRRPVTPAPPYEQFDEKRILAAIGEFHKRCPSFVRNQKNSDLLIQFLNRNQLSPMSVDSFLTANEILSAWNCYDEPAVLSVAEAVKEIPAAPETPAPEPHEPTYAELEAQRRHDYFNKVVVTHPATGQQYTEHDLDGLDSKSELYLRRIMEKNHSGNNLYDQYLNTKTRQEDAQRQLNERARREMEGQ